MNKLIKELWGHIDRKRKVQLILLLLLMVVAALCEVISIGAVIPFLSAFSNPKLIFENNSAQFFINGLNISSPNEILFPLTILFIIAVTISAFFRFLLLLFQTRLGFDLGADFSFKMYRNTLYQPYNIHVKKNSSEVIAGIITKANDTTAQVLMPILIISSSLLMLSMILAALILINPTIFLSAFSGLTIIYYLIIVLTKKKILEDSKVISRESIQVVKILQEGLGGIRDILLDSAQDLYCKTFRKSDVPLRQAKASITVIGGSPRYGVEALGISFIALLTYYISINSGGLTNSLIPLLGAMAMGAQRMLPVIQLTYTNWILIRGCRESLKDTLEILDLPVSEDNLKTNEGTLSFKNHISLKNLSFRYSQDTPWVINNLNLKIKKGEIIGFIGETGCGKSTLLDIIMGLLRAEQESLYVDDFIISEKNYRKWQKHIAHVPQSIFLADSTIAENIAFGIPKDEIDFDLIKISAKKAQIHNTIISWNLKYDTKVGERGIMLSGGQRQRIGIARALYKKADVIIFDEATSALDSKTESSVMESIENLKGDLTIIIVAHRLTTLKNCDQIIELSKGEIKKTGSYNQIIKKRVS